MWTPIREFGNIFVLYCVDFSSGSHVLPFPVSSHQVVATSFMYKGCEAGLELLLFLLQVVMVSLEVQQHPYQVAQTEFWPKNSRGIHEAAWSLPKQEVAEASLT